jgi:uncharacterized protein YejL (UPF0352 family)
MDDVFKAPKLFLMGKMNLIPQSVKGRDAIARIFSRTLEKELKK